MAAVESLVTLSVRVYAQPADATVSHFRERHGRHEVDLIVERPDAAIVAIETKLSDTVTDADVTHLLWLRRQPARNRGHVDGGRQHGETNLAQQPVALRNVRHA